jgi:2-amino-4-hydroxy-6-hydroxymethyldihydropteridine diphosphokinase
MPNESTSTGRTQWQRVWIGLGSNMGERRASIHRALDLLDNRADCRVVASSPLYETAPKIVEDQPAFINGCAELRTRRSPEELMSLLLEVETEMGRDRAESADKGPRAIDLDLLVYADREVDQPELTVPHPGLRAFVLVPLRDIAPDLQVPPDGRTVAELCEACDDEL